VTTVVELRDISKSYQRGPEEVHALRGVSLTLHEGKVVALVGPSGSGKTTLLNCLAGWEHPDSGVITWGFNPAAGSPADLPWTDLAMIPQSVGLLEELSVRENVTLPGRFGSAIDSERVDLLLENLGLDKFADRAPAEISIGEQQRTGLARALVVAPKVLLADEPSGHQDAGWAKGVWGVIREAAADGTACLVATHNQELLQYADRIVGIHDGRFEDVHHDRAHEHEAFSTPRRSAGREEEWQRESPPADDRSIWGPA
jgi:putative ABC transport system ATP-binding protein